MLKDMKRSRLLIVLVLMISSCLNQQPSKITCTVVLDGDTFQLERGEVVRLIGIDAPEHFEPGGDIARDYLASLVLGEELLLISEGEDEDEYGRLLRYAYVGEICVNEEMIKRGYAEVRYLSGDNPRRDYYVKLEIKAEENNLGLWAFNVFQPRSILNWNEDIQIIDWINADKYYGEYVVVEGTVVDTRNTGEVCFLNFQSDWEQYFSVVIFSCDFPEFSEQPEVYYLGKRIHIIGLIKRYKDKPEIIAKTPDQIQVIG